jgi:hypothetical protein
LYLKSASPLANLIPLWLRLIIDLTLTGYCAV